MAMPGANVVVNTPREDNSGMVRGAVQAGSSAKSARIFSWLASSYS